MSGNLSLLKSPWLGRLWALVWKLLLLPCSAVRMGLSSNSVYVYTTALSQSEELLFAASRVDDRGSYLVKAMRIVNFEFSSIHGASTSSLPSLRELCRREDESLSAGGRWRVCGGMTSGYDVAITLLYTSQP